MKKINSEKAKEIYDETALSEYRELAEQGHPMAQLSLGMIHYKGSNYNDAIKWLTRAAEQGQSNAQNQLGVMCFLEQGFTRNYPLSHMWICISALNGNTDSLELKDLIAKQMTPEQIAEAERLTQEWLAKNPTNH